MNIYVFLYDTNGVNLNSKFNSFDFTKSYDVFNENKLIQKYNEARPLEYILQVGNIYIQNMKQIETYNNNVYINIIVKKSVDTLSYDIKVDELIYNVIDLLYSKEINKTINIALPYSYHPVVPHLCANDRLDNSTFDIISMLLQKSDTDNYKIKLL